ncbi:MAG: hypothetical protein ABI472_22150 [Ginsengibacter sp.]
MNRTLIKCVTIVNEGKITVADFLISGESVKKIESSIAAPGGNLKTINAEGLFLIQGMIDDPVHCNAIGNMIRIGQ